MKARPATAAQRVPGTSRRRRGANLLEVLVVAGAAVVAFGVASQFDVFEWFVGWSRRHESWQLDEVLVAAVISTVALAVYSWRRYRETQRETEQLMAAEETLEETTQRYRSLFELNPLAVVCIDTEGRFVESNAAARETLVLQPGDLRGAHLSALVNPADREEADRRFAGMVNGEPQRFDLTVQRGNGEMADLRITGVPIVVAGRVIGAYDLIEDVTSANRVLAELEQATRDAAAASEAKSLFLANMSHEIRTPLTSMLAVAELLEDTEPTPTQQDLLVRMSRSGWRLRRLIDSILDFSAIEAGVTELRNIDFDPREVLQDAADEAREDARGKGLQLRLEVDPLLPAQMTGDPERILQVVSNLLENAVKFTDTGSIVVAGTAAEDGSALITVTDTGVGMSTSDQVAVFETFRQVDPSMTRHHGGSGLGLAICKRLVEDMGGDIWVTSTPGEGSTFAVRLPVHHDQ
jgi:PAS domain S-box-containing protein